MYGRQVRCYLFRINHTCRFFFRYARRQRVLLYNSSFTLYCQPTWALQNFKKWSAILSLACLVVLMTLPSSPWKASVDLLLVYNSSICLYVTPSRAILRARCCVTDWPKLKINFFISLLNFTLPCHSLSCSLAHFRRMVAILSSSSVLKRHSSRASTSAKAWCARIKTAVSLFVDIVWQK